MKEKKIEKRIYELMLYLYKDEMKKNSPHDHQVERKGYLYIHLPEASAAQTGVVRLYYII